MDRESTRFLAQPNETIWYEPDFMDQGVGTSSVTVGVGVAVGRRGVMVGGCVRVAVAVYWDVGVCTPVRVKTNQTS